MRNVKFGNIVREVKVNIDRTHNPYDFYVAGDHMDSEDLTIRRKGRFATDDVGPAFIRLFKPGQVLYGSRRTYLKKVAVADFEGITANTTFVLETKDENVFLQKLLPFLMLSDSFTEWSVKKSKGSTNPYVLFSDLADFEFNLPPIEEQRKLADLLWSAYDLKESYKRLLVASDEMAKSRFVEMFGDPISNPKGWTVKTIRDVVANQKNALKAGPFGSSLKKEFYCSSGYKIYGQEQVIGGSIEIGDYFISKEKYDELKSCAVQAQDVLISLVGTYGKTLVIPEVFYPGIINPRLIKISFDLSIINVKYFQAFFSSEALRVFLDNQTHGCTMGVLNLGIIAALKIPVPPMSLQNEYAAFIEQLDKSKDALQKSIDRLDSVMKNLLNTTIERETT